MTEILAFVGGVVLGQLSITTGLMLGRSLLSPAPPRQPQTTPATAVEASAPLFTGVLPDMPDEDIDISNVVGLGMT